VGSHCASFGTLLVRYATGKARIGEHNRQNSVEEQFEERNLQVRTDLFCRLLMALHLAGLLLTRKVLVPARKQL